ncbi:MAG: radical SAM protein [Pseudomonadota bacterium]
MTIALIYPPTCDPTAPYLSLPTLTAWLRTHGKTVLPIDANVEAYDGLLRGAVMEETAEKIKAALKTLGKKPSLNHKDQMHHTRLWEVAKDLSWIPKAMDDAVAVLRDRTGKRFFNSPDYEAAVQIVQAGLNMISAAYHPLSLDFTGYRTPFSLLTPEQIKADAAPEKNPFHACFHAIGDRLALENPILIGISIAFPGQVQPGFSLAYHLKARFPHVHLTVGGPAITQILVRQTLKNQARILGPFDSVVLYEGEEALLELADTLSSGETPDRIIIGKTDTRLEQLPSPDFDGLPLDLYFSPELILPYDPSRGCYWGKCAFCHYGLCGSGTARYRERKINDMVRHLRDMASQYPCRNFYFSQDAFLPATARKLALALKEESLKIHWSSDMRPEKELTQACCRDLKAGGALSIALGIESASPRVLKLIHKGITVDTQRTAVKNLAGQRIAVEAMCFNAFPTETRAEAETTIQFIRDLKKDLALFICGRFGLWHGSHVALHPELYQIRKIWHLTGDELGTALFHESSGPARSPEDQDRIDDAIDALSSRWWLHDYPWAGSLSTAHTLLWYAHEGRNIFKKQAGIQQRLSLPKGKSDLKSSYDIRKIMIQAWANETKIWNRLIHEQKSVSPKLYETLARDLPLAYPVKIARRT